MKNIFLLIVLFFTFLVATLNTSFAQSDKPQSTTSRRNKSRNLLTKNYYDVSAQYIVWQESIDASGPGIQGNALFQFAGFQFGLNHNKPLGGIRWVRNYGLALTVGTTKGKGEPGNFSDEFKNQPWVALGLSAGLTYRTTAVSELSIFAPVTARYIDWQLASDAAIKLDEQSPFSAGVGFQFTHRYSIKSAMNIAVAHQILWDSTQWSIGYQYSLR